VTDYDGLQSLLLSDRIKWTLLVHSGAF